MKKLMPILLSLVFLACAFPVSASEVPTYDAELPLLTAQVILLNMENAGNGYLLHLKLPDGELTVDAEESCQFIDTQKKRVSSETFLRSYRGRTISITFMEVGRNKYRVLECRG